VIGIVYGQAVGIYVGINGYGCPKAIPGPELRVVAVIAITTTIPTISYILLPVTLICASVAGTQVKGELKTFELFFQNSGANKLPF
jgi:hypothetical protein